MKLFPDRSAIPEAERQLAQAKIDSHASIAQVRSAIGVRLAQPSSLLVVTGLGALLGVWFARRNKPRDKQDGVSVWAPIVGVASTLLIRFAMQRLAERWARSHNTDSQVGITTGARTDKDSGARTK